MKNMLPLLFFSVLLTICGTSAAEPVAITSAPANPSLPKWKTLSGFPPLVIARGGFSGIFSESSQYAYQFAWSPTTVKDLVQLCDPQFTKDSIGICKPAIRLDNSIILRVSFQRREEITELMDSLFMAGSLLTSPSIFVSEGCLLLMY